MALSDVKIDWNAKGYIEMMKGATEDIVKECAERVSEDASRNLERLAPDGTGLLASQIEVKASKFKGGGYVVMAQGTGNYSYVKAKNGGMRPRWYAIFAELGTARMRGAGHAGLGYLRKALRKNKTWLRRELGRRIEAQIRE